MVVSARSAAPVKHRILFFLQGVLCLTMNSQRPWAKMAGGDGGRDGEGEGDQDGHPHSDWLRSLTSGEHRPYRTCTSRLGLREARRRRRRRLDTGIGHAVGSPAPISTHQYPSSMGTKWSMPHDACGGGAALRHGPKKDVEVAVPPPPLGSSSHWKKPQPSSFGLGPENANRSQHRIASTHHHPTRGAR